MANKVYNYDTPGDFTYDTSKIEVSGGIAKLKDLTPANETFYANFNSDINGSRGLGVLTGTAIGEASVTGGKLDLAYGDTRYVTYDYINNFPLQVGTIRFKLIPNYDNTPANDMCFFSCPKALGDYANSIHLYHYIDGSIYFYAYDQIKNKIIGNVVGIWNPTLGQEYEFEIDFDFDGGTTRIFIDGIQFGTDLIGTGTRTNDIISFILGTKWDISTNSNFKIDDFQVFSTIQHTTNYTPIPTTETTYVIDKPTIEPTDLLDPTGPGAVISWDTFLETLGGGNQGSVGYNLYKVDKANKYYWNGSVWVTGGSSSNYNSAITVNANISSFDASPDKIGFIAYLISDGEQKTELDENQITYTQNALPLVNAGSDKTAKDNQTKTPFSDCTFSDSDGTIVKVEYKVDGEVDVWTEIPQGGYGTLLEAVQVFTYQFNNLGTLVVRLKVEDNDGQTAEDDLNMVVSKYTKTINITDFATGLDISGITFNSDDGSVPASQDSPFAYDWEYDTFSITFTKTGYVDGSATLVVSDETSESYTMIPQATITRISYPLTLSVANQNSQTLENIVKGDTIDFECTVSSEDITGWELRAEIYDNDGNSIKKANNLAGGSNTQIEVTNASGGEFTIHIDAGDTTSFKSRARLEIEAQTHDGKIFTVYKAVIKFRSENITWDTP